MPQSIYRGRVEIRGEYLPSQLERPPNFVMVDMVNIVKGGGRAPPIPSPVWADFSIIMDVRQKVVIATLCLMRSGDRLTILNLQGLII
jgi:hypothetical protein